MKAMVAGHSRSLGEAIAAEFLGRGVPVLGLSREHSPALAAEFPKLLLRYEMRLERQRDNRPLAAQRRRKSYSN